MSPAQQQKSGPLKISIDLTDVKEGGGGAKVPEGDYLFEITKVTNLETRDGDKRYLNWACKIIKGKGTGTIYLRTFLTPESLWNLRNFMAAVLNRDIPSKALNFDFGSMVGKKFMGTVADGEPYKGRVRSEIVSYEPAGNYNEAAASISADEADDELSGDSEDDEDSLDEIDTDDL